MGWLFGQSQHDAALGDDFATDKKPLTCVVGCKQGPTKLKVYLKRIDTLAAIAQEQVRAGLASPGAPHVTAFKTGLADYGIVQPGHYFFNVTLSAKLRKKYALYKEHTADIPAQTDFTATLKLTPLAWIRIVLIDEGSKKISGAAWKMTQPVEDTGTTGADGKIEVDVPWNSSHAALQVTLPPGPRIPAPAAVPPDSAASPPPYPVTIHPEQFSPAPARTADPEVVHWSAEIRFITEANDDVSLRARLHNFGFPVDDDPRTTRSVKAYQRLHLKDYNGSGVLGAIGVDLKQRHDKV